MCPCNINMGILKRLWSASVLASVIGRVGPFITTQTQCKNLQYMVGWWQKKTSMTIQTPGWIFARGFSSPSNGFGCWQKYFPTNYLLKLMRITSAFLLPPATKLGQGNIFTGVCDSVNRCGVCSGGGCVSAPGGSAPRGVCLLLGVSALAVSADWWGLLPGGGSAPWGVCSRGMSAPGGAWWRPPPRRLLLRAVRILLECIIVHNNFRVLVNRADCLRNRLKRSYLLLQIDVFALGVIDVFAAGLIDVFAVGLIDVFAAGLIDVFAVGLCWVSSLISWSSSRSLRPSRESGSSCLRTHPNSRSDSTSTPTRNGFATGYNSWRTLAATVTCRLPSSSWGPRRSQVRMHTWIKVYLCTNWCAHIYSGGPGFPRGRQVIIWSNCT